MATVADVEKLALDLCEADRALLAARLLDTLPSPTEETEDGFAEALRRSADLEAHPEHGMTLEVFEGKLRARRR